MRKSILVGLSILFVIGFFSSTASSAEQKEIKVGVIYSMTGAFAPGGALRAYRGCMIAIDMVNERGGVAGKYKIKPIVADAQSSPDVAIREAERLIAVEKVPIIMGVFSSSIGMPLGPLCEKNKTVFFITNAIADAILKDKHFHYVFRHNWTGSQSGGVVMDFLNGNYQKLGLKSPSDLKVAILYEDGPYGVSTGERDLQMAKKYGMKVVFNESYAHDIKDMSSIIMKLKASGQDIISHTGYFPDIVLLYRQGRELGLKTHAILGHGAGYSDAKTLEESLGLTLFNYAFDTNSPAAQNVDRKKLEPETSTLIDEFLRRAKEKYNDPDPTTHYTDGCFHSLIIFNEVMPLALKKYGEINAETIRKALLEVDVPPSRDPRAWGAKYAPPDHPVAGQNLRSTATLLQRIAGKEHVAWPKPMQTVEPKFPMPKDSPLAK
jgi:branched-chain amino acid transport system substrate-binding protein